MFIPTPLQRTIPMSRTPTSDHAGAIDRETGRLRPLSGPQRQLRSVALQRALDEIAAITDETDTDAIWDDVLRGIDESRPHRPLFRGDA